MATPGQPCHRTRVPPAEAPNHGMWVDAEIADKRMGDPGSPYGPIRAASRKVRRKEMAPTWASNSRISLQNSGAMSSK
jgi:hypothetical protein